MAKDTPVAEVAPAPGLAEALAAIQALTAQVAALQAAQKPKVPEVDFSELKAEADKAGFASQTVHINPEGAAPAFRVDY